MLVVDIALQLVRNYYLPLPVILLKSDVFACPFLNNYGSWLIP